MNAIIGITADCSDDPVIVIFIPVSTMMRPTKRISWRWRWKNRTNPEVRRRSRNETKKTTMPAKAMPTLIINVFPALMFPMTCITM